MKKKFLALTVMVCMALSVLTGCESHLKTEYLKNQRLANLEELDLSVFFDEENGFHYPDTTWGMGFQEVQMATLDSLTDMAGYSDGNNMVVYKADGLRCKILGRKNDDANVSFLNNKAYLYSVMFDKEQETGTSATNKEIADYLREELIKVYGEPDEDRETEEKTDNSVILYKTCAWNYTTPAGEETQLQFAAAHVSYSEQPTFVSIGTVWMSDEVKEMDKPAE